jgi:hypothetical protein
LIPKNQPLSHHQQNTITKVIIMAFDPRDLERQYYAAYQALNENLTFIASLQQNTVEACQKINSLLGRPSNANSTWEDLFNLRVLYDFPLAIDHFKQQASIAHTAFPTT